MLYVHNTIIVLAFFLSNVSLEYCFLIDNSEFVLVFITRISKNVFRSFRQTLLVLISGLAPSLAKPLIFPRLWVAIEAQLQHHCVLALSGLLQNLCYCA